MLRVKNLGLLLASVAWGQATTALFDHAATLFLPYDGDTSRFCRENPQTPAVAANLISVAVSIT